MNIWIVVERHSGDIEAVYMNKVDADAHAEEFGDSDMYRMAVEEHEIQPKADWKIV